MIWPFLLAQNVTNLAYMALAFILPIVLDNVPVHADGTSLTALLLISGVTAFDHFAGGLGTAVLMTFLMGLCAGEFKAAHYAIGTGLMSVSAVYAGSFSGFLVNWLGYAFFFGTSFVFRCQACFSYFICRRVVWEQQIRNHEKDSPPSARRLSPSPVSLASRDRQRFLDKKKAWRAIPMPF